MFLHFTNARLIDPETLTDATGSLTVADGVISARDGAVPKGATVIDCTGHCLAPGIVDLGVKIGEPGDSIADLFNAGQITASVGFSNATFSVGPKGGMNS
jgi:dihydroorotase